MLNQNARAEPNTLPIVSAMKQIREAAMNSIIYIVGLIVIVVAILSFLGLG